MMDVTNKEIMETVGSVRKQDKNIWFDGACREATDKRYETIKNVHLANRGVLPQLTSRTGRNARAQTMEERLLWQCVSCVGCPHR